MTMLWSPQPSRAVRQAAIWTARLREKSITLDQLHRFRSWYQQPENRAAFPRLDP
jgi:ferric-dicitrate binding protein FerR (iron transport regulator)